MLFQRSDWTLFRSLDTLGQRAGVPRQRLGAVVVKELVDNALDAGSEKVSFGSLGADGTGAADVFDESLPGFFVEDDGIGLVGDDERIAEMFSIARPLTSSKLLRLPTRGALGNGLRVVTGAVLASEGRLVVRTRGRSLLLTPQFHTGKTLVQRLGPWSQQGTRIEVMLGSTLRVDFSMARLAKKFRGEKTYSGRTSPHWYSSAAFRELVSAAPQEAQLCELLSKFDAPKGKVIHLPEFANRKIGELTDTDTGRIFAALKSATIAPAPIKLGYIGQEAGPYGGYARKTGTYEHAGAILPCVVEVWAERTETYGDVQMLVNRTPVVSQVRHRMSKDGTKSKGVLSGCGLNHYVDTGKCAFNAVINVQVPYMAVTNDGKEPDLKPLYELISDAFAKACRIARKLNPMEKQVRGEKPRSKKEAIADALSRAITKASGGGKYRYSLRQLYYAIRPIVGTDLEYTYFSMCVADIENQMGYDLPGIYRDARGQLYEPHTGRTIALGTLAVEQYKRPKLHFNKVLYIEKGGLVQLLIDNQWPERYDCALVTSQGFASKACKDVLDLLGDTNEEIEFFCIHDADGPGTLIYEALQEASRARPARRVKIINLGLEPSEGRRMGLEVEEFERKSGKVPVASYIEDYDREWLQSRRIELNAMTSPQFLRWLTEKFEAKATVAKKLIPTESELREQAEAKARMELRRRAVEKLLAEQAASIDEQVQTGLEQLDLNITGSQVADSLKAKPEQAWRDAVNNAVTAQIEPKARKSSEAPIPTDLHLTRQTPTSHPKHDLVERPTCPHGSYNLAHCMSAEDAAKLNERYEEIPGMPGGQAGKGVRDAKL